MGRGRNLLLLVSLVVGAACTEQQLRLQGPAAARLEELPVERGDYFGLAWPEDDRLVIGVAKPFRATTENGLMWLSLSGDLQPLPLRDDPTCRRRDWSGKPYNLTDYMFPTTMTDGRVAFVRSCRATNDPLRVIAFDPRDGKRSIIFESSELVAPKPTHWNRDASRGISSISSAICATVVWLHDDHVGDFGVEIPAEDGSWRITRDAADPGLGDCSGEGRADWPAWGAGGEISFFAETASMGEVHFARLDVPYDLYLLEDAEAQAERVGQNYLEPRSPVWSPDGDDLAFSVLRGDNAGTWVYRTDSNGPIRISDSGLLWLAWSPDGNRIAGITDDSDEDSLESRSKVVVLDLRTSG